MKHSGEQFHTKILDGHGAGEFSEKRSKVMCTTIVARLPTFVGSALYSTLAPLRQRHPGHYHYPPHTMHFTVQDISPISRRSDHIGISPKGARALDYLAKDLQSERPLKLELRGLGIFPTTVFAQLIDIEGRITELRHRVAACLRQEAGVELSPPVAPGLVFANLVRFTDVPDGSVAAAVEHHRTLPQMKFDVTEFEIVATDKVLSDRHTTNLAGFTLSGI